MQKSPSPSRVRLQVLTVDGRRVRCRVVPAAEFDGERAAVGSPLLLLHGLGCSSDAWLRTLRRLERRLDHPVFAPDMPGYGHSPGPLEAMGMEELADWSARLLDTIEVPQAHLAGNSMGCQVALAMARRHPDRVGRLVLAGPTMGDHPISASRYLVGLAIDGLREPLHYDLVLLKMYAQMGMRRYLETVRKMLDDRPLTCARQVAARCLVVRGERDAVISDAAARRLASALPEGLFTTIPGAAHAVQYNSPERFVSILTGFVTGNPAEEPHSPSLPDR